MLPPVTSYTVILKQLLTYLRSLRSEKSTLKLTNISPDFIFTDINFTDFIFTDIIIHAKASSVQVISLIIMSDNIVKSINTPDGWYNYRLPKDPRYLIR